MFNQIVWQGVFSACVVRKEDAMYLFNNCHNRQHVAMYGNGAFYDLNTTGFQLHWQTIFELVKRACRFTRSDEQHYFDWYRFVRETVKSDNTGVTCRAFFGKHFKPRRLLEER